MRRRAHSRMLFRFVRFFLQSSPLKKSLHTMKLLYPVRKLSQLRGPHSHLILQPFALVLLPALCKSNLLVASNSRQLTNSMPAVSSGGILMEYEFRSLHSTSQSSSPNVVPLNRVRITRSHSSLLLCSRRVRAAFRSS